MSKFRRSNVCSAPRNRDNENNTKNQTPNGEFNLRKSNKLISHDDFLNRIQKSLYYGGKKTTMSIPLSDLIVDTFSDTHQGYSLNRLNYSTVGNLRSTPCSLILAMIYLERLKDADPAYTKHITPTELFLVSMMVATKFYSGHDDEAPYVNWAECANMTPDNLLQMELAFLTAIDWKVYVSNDEFFDKIKSLEVTLARRQGLHRGWFTYMELDSLMPTIQIAKQILQSALVFGLSYTAFVATMVASVFLVSQIPGTYLNQSSSRASAGQSTNDVTSTTIGDRLQPQSNVNDTKMNISTEHDLSTETNSFDTEILLDINIERLNETPGADVLDERPNRTNWNHITFSSWYTYFKPETFDWSVITNTLRQQETAETNANGLTSNLFCNSTLHIERLLFEPGTERINIDLNGIKMKWA